VRGNQNLVRDCVLNRSPSGSVLNVRLRLSGPV
jgi:hypothetical protein